MVKILRKRKFPLWEIVSLMLFAICLLTIAFCIFTIVGIGFLSFLGFEYYSFKSVLLFFAIYFCVRRSTDVFFTTILDILKYVNRIPHLLYKLVDFFINFSLTFIIMNLLDLMMKSILIPFHTEVLFAILSYAFSVCIDFNSKYKK